jgi:Xaa-Pro aminopeptidase
MMKAWLLLLLSSLASGALAQDVPLYTTDFPPEEFAERRAAVYDTIGENALALVQGAPTPFGFVRFRQSNEFYYLCGVETPHAYLLLDGTKRETRLYLPHRNEARERSEGKLLSADDVELSKKLAGVNEVYATDLLSEHLARFARADRVPALYTPFSPAEGAGVSRDMATRTVADIASDPWDGRPSREGHFIRRLRASFPQFEIRDLSPTVDKLRLIKSPREITLIRRATRLAGLAIMEAIRSTEPGLMERELDGLAKFIFYRGGAQADAYYSLIASGPNAWYAHYHRGARAMRDGELLLMDFGPDIGYYSTDVTRQWPVNGTFNDWQRELYGFYLACYRAILKAIKPGEVAPIVAEAGREMDQALAGWKFSKPEYERSARQFVDQLKRSTSLGHWVGMAVHDVGPHEGVLRPGMVFSIEPQFRIPEEKIYIRLEDMIVITETGAEVLSDFVPMEIEDLEKLYQEDGLLQKYTGAAFESWVTPGKGR